VILKIIKSTTDAKGNVNQRDRDGATPLFLLINHAAHAPERFEILLKKLVKAGADIEAEDPSHNGETPLERAMREDRPDMFVRLIDVGAGSKVNPSTALGFIGRHHSVPGMAGTLRLLEAQSGRFAYFRALSALTQPPGSAGRGLRWVGIESGEVALRPQVEDQLRLDEAKRFIRPASAVYGRRPVVGISYLGKQLFLKADPEMAGMEYAVGSMHRMLIGHGTPETELFKCIDVLGKPFAVLASQAVDGENLQVRKGTMQAAMHSRTLFS
jgi:NLR family CARD domain-containing protein 3